MAPTVHPEEDLAMDRQPARTQPKAVAQLRAELEGRTAPRRETTPFVAHGGKPPSPPRK